MTSTTITSLSWSNGAKPSQLRGNRCRFDATHDDFRRGRRSEAADRTASVIFLTIGLSNFLSMGAREADHDWCIPTAVLATVVRLGVGFPHVIPEIPQICARRAGHRERSHGPWPHRPAGYGAGICPDATATSPSQSAYP